VWNNPERGELDPVDDVRRRCKKNFPSVLSCTDMRTKMAVIVAAKSEQFTTSKAGKGLSSSFEKTEGNWQKKEL